MTVTALPSEIPVPKEWEAAATTSGEILRRARLAVPLLRAAAPAIEDNRRLTGEVVDLLRKVGVWRATMPKEWGGPELTSVEQVELLEILAEGDASAAWCAMIGMDSGLYAGYLDPEVARTIYADLDTITAGALFPTGRANRVPGGYRLTGRWRFASSITHCDVLLAGAFVYAEDAPEPDPVTGEAEQWRVLVGRPEQFQIHDTWFTTGLAGSGSRDYSAENLFIPSEHCFTMSLPRRRGPLHRTPDVIQRKMPGVPLGMAKAALDYVIGMAEGRSDRETGTPWIDDYRVHAAIGRAEMELAAARATTYATVRAQWAALESDKEDLREERVAAALARYHAFQTSRQVVQDLYNLMGGSSVYRTSPLDRWLRDANTMCQHAVAQDAVLQMAGVVRLGGPPPNPVNPALAVSLPAV